MRKNNELLIEILEFYEEHLQHGSMHIGIDDEMIKKISEKDKKTVAGHLALLIDGGLIDGTTHWNPGGIVVKSITFKGHEFLSVSREADVWNNIKGKLKDAPVDTIITLGKEATTTYLRKKIGLS